MRGDFVTVATLGDFGKPRPALIIQADLFDQHSSVTVLPMTSALIEAPLLRITIHPDPDNGLEKISQVMIDKAVTIKREKLSTSFGRIGAEKLLEVERCLALFLGIVK